MSVAPSVALTPHPLTANEYHEQILAPVGEVVIGMERTGVPVDLNELADIQLRMGVLGAQLKAELHDWCPRDINWNSWQQLAEWLHGQQGDHAEDDPYTPSRGLGLDPSPYCKKGEVPDDKISTDDRALEWLAGHNPEHRGPITALRKLRQVERMARYARDWSSAVIHHPDGTTRLHPSFGLASDHDTRPGARTGRFGVKNPALNQVPSNPAHDPAGMKAAFVAPPGCRMIVVDYSQLEVVINADLIVRLFADDSDPLVTRVRSGEDIHGPAARFIFGELAGDPVVAAAAVPDFKTVPALKELRNLGKTGIYGKNYGKGIRGFAWSTFLKDGSPLGMERARLLSEGLDRFYPGIPKYQGFVREWIERYGYIVTPFGRWYPLPHARASQAGLRNRAWRQALNYPMQGGGQEIMAFALIAIAADPLLRELGFVLSLVVHDEIVGWAPEATADRALQRVQQLMVETVTLLCPLRTEGHVGATWKEAKG